jgi:SET domain-containing protein
MEAETGGDATMGGIALGTSAIHGIGGFARVDVPAGSRVIEYRGRRITSRETLLLCESSNACIFALDDGNYVDGNVSWNPARYINHSCEPNAEAELDQDRIWIVARRDIAAGEEITLNYGYDLEDYRDYPCRCGAPGCVGYMVAEVFFAHVRHNRCLQSTATQRTEPGAQPPAAPEARL